MQHVHGRRGSRVSGTALELAPLKIRVNAVRPGPESSSVTGQSPGVEGGYELTRAPSLEFLVRKRFGDAAVSAALAGQIPRRR